MKTSVPGLNCLKATKLMIRMNLLPHYEVVKFTLYCAKLQQKSKIFATLNSETRSLYVEAIEAIEEWLQTDGVTTENERCYNAALGIYSYAHRTFADLPIVFTALDAVKTILEPVDGCFRANSAYLYLSDHNRKKARSYGKTLLTHEEAAEKYLLCT